MCSVTTGDGGTVVGNDIPGTVCHFTEPPDKLLVSVQENGIQRPSKALSARRLTDKEARSNAIGQPSCKRLFKVEIQMVVYLL